MVKGNVYTSSATIHRLINIEKLSEKDVAKVLKATVKRVKSIYKAEAGITKDEYLRLIDRFPHFEGSVEYFENIKKG